MIIIMTLYYLFAGDVATTLSLVFTCRMLSTVSRVDKATLEVGQLKDVCMSENRSNDVS